MFEDPDAFKPDEVREIERQQHRPIHTDEEHEHGPDCGHEAVRHGDHWDYVHDDQRHYLHEGRWQEH
jgi:hypothetical protein